ncbi:MAG: AAA domain-containing protein [Gammaproteobacteria bacterium]|nr:AAA domain-containing protein [Gammaproteobacteria bacterium]
MHFLKIKPEHQTIFASRGELPERVHLFDKPSIDAINAALAAKRPLLVRGEPGIGKSQLARAAAKELKRVFVQQVIDSHCESQDLMWHFDAVQRLADAQLGGALQMNEKQIEQKLRIENYLHPGPLWQAFDWNSAATQAAKLKIPMPAQEEESRPENGCVLLIDEIDKAEMDVPNGLLEALGEGQFTPKGWKKPIAATSVPPLVIITTNEERALPKAFIRRCLVLCLKLVEDEKDLVSHLAKRGRAHFRDLDETVLNRAAELLKQDRQAAREARLEPLPGQAEYLDLLRAVHELAKGDTGKQLDLLAQTARYTVKKYADSGS